MSTHHNSIKRPIAILVIYFRTNEKYRLRAYFVYCVDTKIYINTFTSLILAFLSFCFLPYCRLPVFLSYCMNVFLTAFLTARLPVFLPACLFVSLSVCLPACLSVSLPAFLSSCLPICLSICLPSYLPSQICLPAGLPICSPAFVCLHACLSGLYLPACVAACLCIYPFDCTSLHALCSLSWGFLFLSRFLHFLVTRFMQPSHLHAFVCLSVFMCVCLCGCMSVCLSVFMCVCL